MNYCTQISNHMNEESFGNLISNLLQATSVDSGVINSTILSKPGKSNFGDSFGKFFEKGKVTKEKAERYNSGSKKFFDESKLREDISILIQEMFEILGDVPLLSSIDGVIPIFNVVKAVSFSCTTAIVAYKGFKLLFSPDDNNKLLAKDLLSRMSYGLILGSISLKLVDLLIAFCNIINKILKSKFSLGYLGTGFKSAGMILPLIILIIEMLSAIKIIIEFCMRMAELVFLGVISPAMFTLWINEEWSGYLKQWWRRVSVLVFTQTAQILMLVIYGMLINGLALSGTLQGALLSIGLLLMVGQAPKIISQFCGSSQGNINTFKRAYRSVNRYSKARMAKKIASKAVNVNKE